MNICLVRASQFLKQFWLMVCYKPGKEYIIPNALSRLVNINIDHFINDSTSHSELDTLFTYSITLAEISPNFLKRIIKDYVSNNCWAKLLRQLCTNEELGTNKPLILFIIEAPPLSNTDPYFIPYLHDTKVDPLYNTGIEPNCRYSSKSATLS